MSAMKQFSDASGGPIGVAIAVAGVLAALYFLGSAARKAVVDAATAAGNINDGTPYAGTGLVGTVGHATDVVAGNVLSDFGSWLGGSIYDLTHSEPDLATTPYDGGGIIGSWLGPKAPAAATPPYVPRAISVRQESLWYEKLLGPVGVSNTGGATGNW